MSCPNCGAQGGGPAGCGSCGLGKRSDVGGHINAGQTQMKIEEDRKRNNNGGGGCLILLVPFALIGIAFLFRLS